MATEIRHYVKKIGDNPLDAVLAERHTKAYLVAQFAIRDGAEVAAKHYNIHLGTVYGAMAFYEDNRSAIEKALEDAHQGLLDLGMRYSEDVMAEIKQRMADQNKSEE